MFSKGVYKIFGHDRFESSSQDFFIQTSYGTVNMDNPGLSDIINNEGVIGAVDFGLSGELLNYSKSYSHFLIIISYIGGWIVFFMSILKIVDFFIGEKLYLFKLYEKVINYDKFIYKKSSKNIVIRNDIESDNNDEYCSSLRFNIYSNLESKYKPNKSINRSPVIKRNSNFNNKIKEVFTFSNEFKIEDKTQENKSSQMVIHPNGAKNQYSKQFNLINKNAFRRVSADKSMCSIKNLIFPYICINSNKKVYGLVILNHILAQILSLENIYNINKLNFQSLIISDKDSYSFSKNISCQYINKNKGDYCKSKFVNV